MKGKNEDASAGGYARGKETKRDPDLEAEARALGISYNISTGEISTDCEFDTELAGYKKMLDTVGLPKDVTIEDHYSTMDRFVLTVTGWFHAQESDAYLARKASVDESAKKRVAKHEKTSRIRNINEAVTYFGGLVQKCDQTIRKHRDEISRINTRKYVSQGRQAEEDVIFKEKSTALGKSADDYQSKDGECRNGENGKYKEVAELERVMNDLMDKREVALAAREHYTSLIEAYNQQVELRTQGINIASAAKTKHYETLVGLKQKKDKLEFDEYDLIKVFGEPEKIKGARKAAFKADEMAEQQTETLKVGLKVAQRMQGLGTAYSGNSEDYAEVAKQAEIQRLRASEERFRKSRQHSKDLLSTRVGSMVVKPSEIFGEEEATEDQPEDKDSKAA